MSEIKRIPLTDGTGRWFDESKATKFSEDTYWDGRNDISKATGGQWDHEALYYTAGKQWIKNRWSNYQGTRETYEVIDADEAARWLVENDHEHPAVVEQIAGLEVA